MDVQEYLAEKGPALSSRVACFLVEKSGISSEAARKRISRLRPPVCKLQHCGLPKNEAFLYLKDQRASERYFEALKDALTSSGSALGRVLIALEARHGYIYRDHLPAASGLPVKPVKKQLPYSTAEKYLFDLDLVRLEPTKSGDVVGLIAASMDLNRHRATALAEDIVLGSLRSWMVKLGIASSQATKVRADAPLPSFGPFNWDLVGPSYLAGLATRVGPLRQNAFVVADILLDREVTRDDLKPFLHKCDTISNQKKHRRFLPVFVADRLERAALDELRKRGHLIGIVSNLFGDDIAQQLRELISIVRNAAAAIVKRPDAVFDLLDKLSKIEGASGNLRGILFEFMVADSYRRHGYQIDMRQAIRTSKGEEAEIDVKAIRTSDEVVCVECKAKVPGNRVDISEVEDWVENRLPRIKDWLRSCPSLPPKNRFEFCISGQFTDRARVYADEVAAKYRKQPLSFLTGEEIRSRLQRWHQSSLVKVYDEHFADRSGE